MSKRTLDEMSSTPAPSSGSIQKSSTQIQQDEFEESSTIPTKSRRMVRRKKEATPSVEFPNDGPLASGSSIPMSSLSSTTISTSSNTNEKDSFLNIQNNSSSNISSPIPSQNKINGLMFSEKEISGLDQNFGRLFYALNLLYRRGFSDFSVAALNEKCGETGERFTLELLQTIQCIVPELFTLYYNYHQQLCLELKEDFEKKKSVIIGLWKKRLSNPGLIECKTTPTIEKRTLGLENESMTISKQTVSQRENNEQNSNMLPPPPRPQQETKKQSLQEMLQENDRREIEELARQHWLTKKFECDRACETLLLLFTIMKMSKKTKMEINTLVETLKSRYPRAITNPEIMSHLHLFCKHAPSCFSLNTFGTLKVFEMNKNAKFEMAKQSLESGVQ
ncbi:hypothetical protein C9374_005314 [Naegleria lovaniensis]|uniref:Uncharacterized protein n=1 Tax=Naegleria lovaniensis TaxID=51637 RepID=A0AA88GPB2_NAELO|nr:uncharacterized protein C9374_005314 [Naegleria lovaniensis]KAG2382734.1 hypothetical protein C9374_005314 [Naegleria lovaniensis]